MANKLTLSDVEDIISTHVAYWDACQHIQNSLTKMLKQELFKDQSYIALYNRNDVIIEPAAAHAVIEGYIASLYPKAPAVIVGPDAKQQGQPEIVEGVVNRFLYDQSEVIERAMKNALVYPFSFLKLALLPEAESIIDQIEMKPVFCWDVVIDFDADKFESSRYVGHRYWLPISTARQRFPGVKFKGELKRNYLNTTEAKPVKGTPLSGSGILSYVEIYEIYDLMNDHLIFFSDNLERTDKIIERVSPIPFRKYNGAPLSPLVPIYFSQAIDVPLQGESTLRRVYDSIVELINLRTVWANGIRKEARQMIARKGALDEEAKAIFSENRDGAILEVEALPGESIVGAIQTIPVVGLSPDFSVYESLIERDLSTGTMMGSFARGNLSASASATEIAAITQYTSSELGKMARVRDRFIEYLAEVYASMTAFLLLTSDKDKETITFNGKVYTIDAADFIGKFRFSAADQASTPISAALKKQTIASMLAPLQSLGVPQDELLNYIVRTFDLPPSFIPEAVETPAAAPGPVGPGGMPAPSSAEGTGATPEPLPVGGGSQAAAIRGTMGQ